jgi:LmbE family N-acetylglucosaminyl deacetylase
VNPFQTFVSESARIFQNGKKLSAGKPKPFKRSKIPANAPRALIFSPHPDDECITGALALRLLREAKWNVINVAVTLGSKKERRTARLRELQAACDFLGFDLVAAGLEKINLETRKKNQPRWNAAVGDISKILAQQKPRAIFLPHARDGHSTHIGAHFLVLDAMKKLPESFECHVVETEFWGQMTHPNLLVESGVEEVGDLVAALACHAGEVRRNRLSCAIAGVDGGQRAARGNCWRKRRRGAGFYFWNNLPFAEMAWRKTSRGFQRRQGFKRAGKSGGFVWLLKRIRPQVFWLRLFDQKPVFIRVDLWLNFFNAGEIHAGSHPAFAGQDAWKLRRAVWRGCGAPGENRRARLEPGHVRK